MPATTRAPFTKLNSTLSSTDVLRGKRCLVTGATGGLGREIARSLSRREARLFLTGRDAPALESLARALGAMVSGATADLGSPDGVMALVAAVRRAFGGIDVLVNNAGVFPVKTLADSTAADYEQCFAVNVRAPFLLARAFAPEMAEAGWGESSMLAPRRPTQVSRRRRSTALQSTRSWGCRGHFTTSSRPPACASFALRQARCRPRWGGS